MQRYTIKFKKAKHVFSIQRYLLKPLKKKLLNCLKAEKKRYRIQGNYKGDFFLNGNHFLKPRVGQGVHLNHHSLYLIHFLYILFTPYFKTLF